MPYKKFKFRYEKDELNGHYAYLLPLDEFTGRCMTIAYAAPWFDGMETPGVVVLYNGRIMNERIDLIKPL